MVSTSTPVSPAPYPQPAIPDTDLALGLQMSALGYMSGTMIIVGDIVNADPEDSGDCEAGQEESLA